MPEKPVADRTERASQALLQHANRPVVDPAFLQGLFLEPRHRAHGPSGEKRVRVEEIQMALQQPGPTFRIRTQASRDRYDAGCETEPQHPLVVPRALHEETAKPGSPQVRATHVRTANQRAGRVSLGASAEPFHPTPPKSKRNPPASPARSAHRFQRSQNRCSAAPTATPKSTG